MADQPKSKMDVGMQEALRKQKEKENKDEELKKLVGTGTARQAAEAIIKRKKDLAEAMKE